MSSKSESDNMSEQINQATIRDYQTTITILEHLSEAIFILKPDGFIQYANRVACDLLNVALKQILGKNLNDYLEPPFQFQENEKNFLEQIYQNGVLELESNLANGEHSTPVIISFGFVRNAQDEVEYIIASARDVSQRKNLEKELYQQQLYLQSRDRYRELGELAINIVHRLSQPITSIRLLIEMLQKNSRQGQIDSVGLEKKLSQVNSMLNQMNEVISNVRNFAFLTEEEDLKPVDLMETIQNAIQHLHYEITENDVEVFINKDKELPKVLADPLNVQQALSTLFRFFLGKTKPVGKQLQIDVKNGQQRWVEVVVHSLQESEEVPLDQWQQSTSLEQNFNLAVVQLMVISCGGNFNHFTLPGKEEHIFILRFPAAHSDDRQQLLNMIDLMQQ